MVKLSESIIINQLAKNKNNVTKSREEVNSKFLKTVSHLYFQNKNIHEIDVITVCSNLKVLYLQGNSLTNIENLNFFTKLTHLYLQDNKICKIENLDKLTNLEKLYIGHNCIAVVEGLDKLKQLKELHLEKQKLPPGEALQFDPRTMESLSDSLLLLDISRNGLNSLWDMCPLKTLTQLNAGGNNFQSFPGVCEPLSTLANLQVLDLSGNEICSLPKYRDAIVISASAKLELLDNKRVHQLTREFVQNFDNFRKQQSVTVIQQSDLPGLMASSKSEHKEISELALYNNLPTKPGLVTTTPLFPPWSLKIVLYVTMALCVEPQIMNKPLNEKPLWNKL